uniref:Uncharacterized protein n=1 Tax=Pundamilia nyererei TaxID=303518 RepID=A0A3B4GA94_9CICH
MGSRALSHDSIFLDDLVMTEPEPTRVLSQENVHSKIKALQVRHFFILAVNLAGVFAQSDNKSLLYKHLFNILNEPI